MPLVPELSSGICMHTLGRSHHVAQSSYPHQKDWPWGAAAGGGRAAHFCEMGGWATHASVRWDWRWSVDSEVTGGASEQVKLPHTNFSGNQLKDAHICGWWSISTWVCQSSLRKAALAGAKGGLLLTKSPVSQIPLLKGTRQMQANILWAPTDLGDLAQYRVCHIIFPLRADFNTQTGEKKSSESTSLYIFDWLFLLISGITFKQAIIK